MELKVNILKAILTHNTDIGSKMDPFVVVKVGHQQRKSRVLKLAGDMPQFNQTFTFDIKHKYQKFHLIVYDQDLTTNDLVGEMILDIKDLINQSKIQPKWYSLKYNVNKPAGKILLGFQCSNNKQMQFMINNVVKNVLQPHVHRIGDPQNITTSYGHRNAPIHQIGYKQYNEHRNIQHSHQPQLSNALSHQNSINYENGPYKVQQSVNSNGNSNHLYSSLSSHQVNKRNNMKQNQDINSNNNSMKRSNNTIIENSQNNDNINRSINNNMYQNNISHSYNNNINQSRSINYMKQSNQFYNNHNIVQNSYINQNRVINSVQCIPHIQNNQLKQIHNFYKGY